MTAMACIPEDARMKAAFAARKPGVLAGIDCVRLAVLAMDPKASIELKMRDGDAFVINGAKHFISHAGHADFAIVFAVTDTYEHNGRSCSRIFGMA